MPNTQLNTGVTLHYKHHPNPGKETLVFINGLTMDTTAWKQAERHFRSDYATLRYDCRGQGESDKPAGPYTPEQHTHDLIALLDALNITRAHLIGLSNGGLISILAAAQLGHERIQSVSAVDSFVQADALLQIILDSWKNALECGGTTLRFDVATPWVWGQGFLAAFKDEVLAFRDKAAMSDRAAIAALIEGLRGFDNALDALEAYEGPVLALVGEDDVLTPPRHAEQIARHAKRGQLVVLENAGHAAPIERPQDVARIIHNFLKEQL